MRPSEKQKYKDLAQKGKATVISRERRLREVQYISKQTEDERDEAKT